MWKIIGHPLHKYKVLDKWDNIGESLSNYIKIYIYETILMTILENR